MRLWYTRAMAAPQLLRWTRWLIPISALVTLAGYFGPWVPHRAAGLVVTGLDLGEYVKFLVPVVSGQVSIWREAFYLPLFTVSIALSLLAFRAELAYVVLVRAMLLALAAVSALNMLPPAWTPGLLRTPEFRLQTAAIVVCLAALLISPLLALLPRWVAGVLIPILALASVALCAIQFNRVLPAIEDLYDQSLTYGWGFWLTPIGLLMLAGSSILFAATAGPASLPDPSASPDAAALLPL